jgi:catechol 2,3-dioxygenase-like lactoylglutathione lyase family enzyme
MLANSPVIGFIPTRDAARARTFFEKTLGLRFVSDDSFALVFDANGTTIRIARVPEFTPFPFTLLGWEVTNIEKIAAEMSAHGVQFQRYDFLQQDAAGIWTAPGAVVKVAWFTDPDGNILSISQH